MPKELKSLIFIFHFSKQLFFLPLFHPEMIDRVHRQNVFLVRRHFFGCCCSLQPPFCEPTSCGCHAGSCLHSRLLQRQSCADAYPQGGPDVHQGPVLHPGGPGALIVQSESVIDHHVPVISIISLSHCRAGLLEQL